METNTQLAHVPVGKNGVQFSDMDGMVRFAGAVVKSGLAPKSMARVEQVFIALQMGMEVGLSPMQAVQNIAVINGKPSIYGDGALALAMGTGRVEDFEERIDGEGDKRGATCTVKRKGVATPTVITFSVADAKTAGLWGKSGPWKQFPNRMLQMRARGFALRNAFPDALHGLITAEEAQDMPNSSPVAPMPKRHEEAREAIVVEVEPEPAPPVEIYEAEVVEEEPATPDDVELDISNIPPDGEVQKQSLIADIRMLAADEGWSNGELKRFVADATDTEVSRLADLDVFQLGAVYDKMMRPGGN